MYNKLCPGKAPLKPRIASIRTLQDPSIAIASNESILDPSALILYFPSPRTVTGEDVLELHVHGGQAVVKAVLAAIPRCVSKPGAIRYAEAGEFTRRAFGNGRLDLTQVEALGDTLSATTEQQRRLSVRGTTGGLATKYEEWRKLLLYARGELEALIDFSEDQQFEETPDLLTANISRQVRLLRQQLDAHRANAVRGELLREGISIALLGAPNAGKSSLLNRIVGREAAIVSHEAGTTRDIVDVGVDIGGWFCRLGDTAGLRRNSIDDASAKQALVGSIEQEGIKRAKQRALGSDVVIVVLPVEEGQLHLDPEVLATAQQCHDDGRAVVVVVNKSDQARSPSDDIRTWTKDILSHLPGVDPTRIFAISCKDAMSPAATVADPGNIQAFLHGLMRTFNSMTSPLISDLPDSVPTPDNSSYYESLGASERHRLLLEECISHLDNFTDDVSPALNSNGHGREVDLSADSQWQPEEAVVVAAERLRLAAACLARITGRGEGGDVEEVLGVVFEK